MTLAEGRAGESKVAGGAIDETRLGPYRDLIVNDSGLGRYFEAMRIGRTFIAANTGGVALSLLNATATGLILTNPAGSGRLLVVEQITAANTVAIAAVGAVGVAANVNPVAAAVTHTTPLVVRAAALGSSATGVGLADSAATLPAAPVFVRFLYGVSWVTTGATAEQISIQDEVAGALALTPGTAISLSAVTTAYTVAASITWTEVDWPLV